MLHRKRESEDMNNGKKWTAPFQKKTYHLLKNTQIQRQTQKMTGLDTCSTSTVHSPLISTTVFNSICLLLQLSLIIFTIHHYHVKKDETLRYGSIARLCLLSQIVGILYISHIICISELDPLLQWNYKNLFYCQVINWGLGYFLGTSYYGTLLMFWAWRLQRVFSSTIWELSSTFIKVRALLWNFPHVRRDHVRTYTPTYALTSARIYMYGRSCHTRPRKLKKMDFSHPGAQKQSVVSCRVTAHSKPTFFSHSKQNKTKFSGVLDRNIFRSTHLLRSLFLCFFISIMFETPYHFRLFQEYFYPLYLWRGRINL